MLNKSAEIPTDVYWAGVETERLPDACAAQAGRFWQRISQLGLVDVWRRSHRTFYGVDGQGGWSESTAVTYGGEGGEVVMVRANHYRSIAQALTAMATGMRPAFEARSVNTDAKSLREAPLATGLVDYTYRRLDLEDVVTRATESAVKYAEGWVGLRWDPFAGRVHVVTQRQVHDEEGRPVFDAVEVEESRVDPVSGQVIVDRRTERAPRMEDWPAREGDIVGALLMPHEVVRDIERAEHRWMLVPHREDAWELAARYPQHRQRILALRGAQRWPRGLWGQGMWEQPEKGDDQLSVWTLYHLPCDALPRGRYAILVGDVVLADEPMPFDELPVYGLLPMRHDGHETGYSPMWDLLCLQEVYDAVLSSLASQFDAGGIGNVVAPKGSDVSPEMLSRALQLIEYEVVPEAPGGGKPEALDLFRLRDDHLKLLEVLQRLHETLSGINSVVRGDPDANLKSGAALALVQSLSAHFTSHLQRANARGHEAVGTGVLRMYRRFATTKRVAEVAGRSNRTAMREWSRDDLAGVDRVTIELGNPLMRQRSGIQQVAETLLAAEMFETRDEYLTFLETGRLEPAYDEQTRRQLAVTGENEALQDGEPVRALWADDHPLHMRRHLALLDDPEARADDALVRRVAAHVEEHKMLWLGMDPAIAAALGVQPPPPPMMPPPGAPPPGGGPPGTEGPPPPAPGGGGAPPAEGRAVPGGLPGNATAGLTPPGMPFMPTNPLTGERVPPTPTAV